MKIQIRFHEPRFSKKAIAEFNKSVYHETRIDYLLWALEPEFYFSSAGLFLTTSQRKTEKSDYNNLTKEKGKFNAEGLVNHIHLDHIIRNPLWQFEIGLRAIKSWENKLESSKFNCKTVIYLNEQYEASRRVNYCLCIYSDPSNNELTALESHWVREVKVLSFKQFLNWTKERI